VTGLLETLREPRLDREALDRVAKGLPRPALHERFENPYGLLSQLGWLTGHMLSLNSEQQLAMKLLFTALAENAARTAFASIYHLATRANCRCGLSWPILGKLGLRVMGELSRLL